MKIKPYKKTPHELYKLIQLFYQHKLDYLLFKCEHIFEGTNKNLDILFETNKDYYLASKLLKDEGFVLYLSEKIEKYKRMYVKIIGKVLYSVHLHRKISWHGIIAIDKQNIFARKRNLTKQIIVPSEEDYLLIHSAHILFENYKIGKSRKLFEPRLSPHSSSKMDWEYIKNTASRNGWQKELSYLLTKFKKNEEPNKKIMIKLLMKKAFKSPENWPFFISKLFQIFSRTINLKRKGCLITLIGVNGAGKSTLTKNVLEQYKPITKFFNGQFGYYFGWDPLLPTTKIVSKVFKRKNKSIFKELNKEPHNGGKSFSLLKELILIYDYIEYLARYFFHIYPKLIKNKLVVTDRYFYDIYSQHNYAQKSKIIKLLLSIYPRPNYLFVLDADLETLTKRKKEINLFSKNVKRTEQRKVHDKQYLSKQKERYKRLSTSLGGKMLSTNSKIEENVNTIIKDTWRGLTK